MKSKPLQISTLVTLLVLIGGILFFRQDILDWTKLYNYTPPPVVSTIAADTTMTDTARHLFYVNHPAVTRGTAFLGHCPAGTEKTVVLGCYIGNDQGIYIYDITDTRLNGVEQVTAAHEMLHAAYARLSSSERKNVDAMLTSYYTNELTDQRIKDTIEAYKKSEPKDVVNEMHSIFGTEIADLPVGLETYYKRYFTNRDAVTTYTATYQAEFTSRQNQVATYDSQLKGLKDQIDANQAQLVSQRNALDIQSKRMQAQRSSGDTTGYNDEVSAYNRGVVAYNALLNETKKMINQYNDIVTVRNQIALEEQELAKQLSASSVTDQ